MSEEITQLNIAGQKIGFFGLSKILKNLQQKNLSDEAELNIAADVDHVRDVNQIAEYGMVRTPSLLINDEIVLHQRSLPKSQLKKLLEEKLK